MTPTSGNWQSRFQVTKQTWFDSGNWRACAEWRYRLLYNVIAVVIHLAESVLRRMKMIGPWQRGDNNCRIFRLVITDKLDYAIQRFVKNNGLNSKTDKTKPLLISTATVINSDYLRCISSAWWLIMTCVNRDVKPYYNYNYNFNRVMHSNKTR